MTLAWIKFILTRIREAWSFWLILIILILISLMAYPWKSHAYDSMTVNGDGSRDLHRDGGYWGRLGL
jgi:hypothetical protein